jgi:GrpB-like predicted nucleotidyltransferase (UPF0157 family)
MTTSMADETEDRSGDIRTVHLAPHDTAWAGMAAAEAGRIAPAVGDTLVRIEHIGSTAIPGIAAKPIIDLMPVVRGLEALDARREAVEALGYLWRGEFGIPGRRYCPLGHDGRRLFHVHFFAAGDGNIARHVAFRDYLRAYRDEALAYETVKRAAAEAQPDDSHAYNDHKSDWIRACQERALAWAAGR